MLSREGVRSKGREAGRWWCRRCEEGDFSHNTNIRGKESIGNEERYIISISIQKGEAAL